MEKYNSFDFSDSRERLPDIDPDYVEYVEISDEIMLNEVDNLILDAYEILEQFDDEELKDLHRKIKKLLEKETAI